jgi:hypothetical protein
MKIKNKNNKNWFFVILLFMTAIIISGTAAYFSVFGLSKLFAGAGLSALILFGALEFGKLVSVTVLYRFWKKFSIMMRLLFTTMVLGIMMITSMGIYGFLRSAYEETSNQYNVITKESKIREKQKEFIQLELNRYTKEIDSKNNQINTYISNRTTQENLVADLYGKSSDTSMSTNQKWVYRTRAKETQESIKETDEQITLLRNDNLTLNNKISSLNDSIMFIDREIIQLESSDISVEIGPLKYLSELTNKPMDDVVSYLIFLIIFVFDPFAIMLILSANKLSMSKKNEEIEEIDGLLQVNNDKNKILQNENNKKLIEKYIKENYPLIKNDKVTEIENELSQLKNTIQETDKKIINLDEFINNIKENTNLTDIELESISDTIESINKKIENLPENELPEFKIEIKDKLNNFVNKLNENIKNNQDNSNSKLIDLINNMKINFDDKLNNINKVLKQNDIIEIDPKPTGRNSHRASIRRI